MNRVIVNCITHFKMRLQPNHNIPSQSVIQYRSHVSILQWNVTFFTNRYVLVYRLIYNYYPYANTHFIFDFYFVSFCYYISSTFTWYFEQNNNIANIFFPSYLAHYQQRQVTMQYNMWPINEVSGIPWAMWLQAWPVLTIRV